MWEGTLIRRMRAYKMGAENFSGFFSEKDRDRSETERGESCGV